VVRIGSVVAYDLHERSHRYDLGFGDITPVVGIARAGVAVEAVLGIVIAGLFINAVARRRSLSRRGDDPTA
jgi:hypothetical protein